MGDRGVRISKLFILWGLYGNQSEAQDEEYQGPTRATSTPCTSARSPAPRAPPDQGRTLVHLTAQIEQRQDAFMS